MSTNGNSQPDAELTRKRIETLLQDIPVENLAFIEQFVQFMRQQSQSVVVIARQEGETPYIYPTVPVPASTFSRLAGIIPPVGGDALSDTEALYDDM